ncbi:hypothetical protein ACLB2K_063825 [Fragaria x ananassa]
MLLREESEDVVGVIEENYVVIWLDFAIDFKERERTRIRMERKLREWHKVLVRHEYRLSRNKVALMNWSVETVGRGRYARIESHNLGWFSFAPCCSSLWKMVDSVRCDAKGGASLVATEVGDERRSTVGAHPGCFLGCVDCKDVLRLLDYVRLRLNPYRFLSTVIFSVSVLVEVVSAGGGASKAKI